jgi:chromosomal replication initiation ATPase DnaA
MTSQNLQICKAVAKCFGISTEAILAKGRKQPQVFARQIVMALCFDHSKSWGSADEEVAAEFNCDRTTIIYARKKIEEAKTVGALREQHKILTCEEAVRRLML